MSALAHDTRTGCERDPELFHAPDREGRQDRIDREAAAKAICATCPFAVRQSCLQIAMDAENGNGAQHREGIYGGLTPTERAALDGRAVVRAPKPPTVCGTEAGAARHRRAGEPVCRSCKSGEATARTERDRRRKKAAA